MATDERAPGGLNENHRRRLYATCRYLDKLLVSIEGVLNVSDSRALFHRFDQVLPSETRTTIIGRIEWLRQTIVETLARHGIGLPAPPGDQAFAIEADLRFMDDTLEELLPQHMKGYGPLSPEAAASLERIVHDLREGLTSIHVLVDAAKDPAASSPRLPPPRRGPLRGA
jgi:hypothetical protein